MIAERAVNGYNLPMKSYASATRLGISLQWQSLLPMWAVCSSRPIYETGRCNFAYTASAYCRMVISGSAS